MEILSVTIPLFIFMIGGYIAKEKGIIGEEIKDFLSKFVFYIAFPAMTFRSINQFDFTETFDVKLICHNATITFIMFLFSLILVIFIRKPARKGVFNMSCFRGNQGYMGLPIIKGFYGEQYMSKAAVVNCFDSISVTFLSVISLEMFRGGIKREEGKSKLAHALFVFLDKMKAILTNPYIMSAIIGLIFAGFDIPILEIGIIDKVLGQTENLALPLALISVGCSIEIKSLKKNVRFISVVAFLKLIFAPTLAVIVGKYIFGLTGDLLGTGVILISMPTSISSYVIAKEMDADADLMATVISVSTFLSVLSITLAQYVLKTFLI